MKQILLLDDSSSIQKVVKLTFSDLPNIEIKVARTQAEADNAVAEAKPDVIIAYALFSKANPVEYLEAKRRLCSEILLLAQSDQDIKAFETAGFSNILRKPFVSADLRSIVKKLLHLDESELVSKEPEEKKLPTLPPPPLPQIDNALRDTQSIPEKEGGEEASQLDLFSRENISEYLFKTASFAPPSIPPLGMNGLGNSKRQPDSAPPAEEIPEITIDVLGIEKSLKCTRATFGEQEEEIKDFSSENDKEGEEKTLVTNEMFTEGRSEGEISFNNFERDKFKEISLDEGNSNESFEIESVVIHPKGVNKESKDSAISKGLGEETVNWKEEIQSAVDDAIFKILERAVPARIDASVELQFPKIQEQIFSQLKAELSNDFYSQCVSDFQTQAKALLEEEKNSYKNEFGQEIGTIKTQILDEVVKMRQALAGSLLNDVRSQIHEAIQNWMDKHLLEIAEAEIKGEIQKLLAEI